MLPLIAAFDKQFVSQKQRANTPKNKANIWHARMEISQQKHKVADTPPAIGIINVGAERKTHVRHVEMGF